MRCGALCKPNIKPLTLTPTRVCVLPCSHRQQAKAKAAKLAGGIGDFATAVSAAAVSCATCTPSSVEHPSCTRSQRAAQCTVVQDPQAFDSSTHTWLAAVVPRSVWTLARSYQAHSLMHSLQYMALTHPHRANTCHSLTPRVCMLAMQPTHAHTHGRCSFCFCFSLRKVALMTMHRAPS